MGRGIRGKYFPSLLLGRVVTRLFIFDPKMLSGDILDFVRIVLHVHFQHVLSRQNRQIADMNRYATQPLLQDFVMKPRGIDLKMTLIDRLIFTTNHSNWDI
jgi:hypothetical protein